MQKIHPSNVGKTIINDPFGTGFIPDHLFMMTLEVVDYCLTSIINAIIELALLPISQPTPIHVYPMIHLDLRQIRGSI